MRNRNDNSSRINVRPSDTNNVIVMDKTPFVFALSIAVGKDSMQMCDCKERKSYGSKNQPGNPGIYGINFFGLSMRQFFFLS